jgi:aliphatic aldoxime dehydratase
MSIQIYDRVNPLRKPKGFEPVVQRWSVGFVNGCDELCVAFHGIQGMSAKDVYASSFFRWIEAAFALPSGPTVHDHAWFVDQNGLYTHVVAGYWVDREKRDRWMAEPHVKSWWEDEGRLSESTGYFRESVTVPVERQESIYWQDYPAGLMRSKEVSVYPTLYCGYYGAMRDRIPVAAVDDLASPMTDLPAPQARATRGARCRIVAPRNLAVIRSAAFWGRCDPTQTEDYMRELRAPLERGMDYLRESPSATGCCSLRFQQTCDITGVPQLETHALGYFLSLKHMENWAENHASHEAIFSAAIARYRKYGKSNQLRTWHEVFVLTEDGNIFEYVNCAPGTGLSSYFEAEMLAV